MTERHEAAARIACASLDDDSDRLPGRVAAPIVAVIAAGLWVILLWATGVI